MAESAPCAKSFTKLSHSISLSRAGVAFFSILGCSGDRVHIPFDLGLSFALLLLARHLSERRSACALPEQLPLCELAPERDQFFTLTSLFARQPIINALNSNLDIRSSVCGKAGNQIHCHGRVVKNAQRLL